MDKNLTLEIITHQDLILTVNRRLAAYLRKMYDNLQLAKGIQAYPSATILPLQSWLELTWDASLENTRLRLSDYQEILLWEKSIENSSYHNPLLNLHETAKMAKETWDLLQHWMISIDSLATYTTNELEAFIEWSKRFEKLCNEEHVIAASRLSAECIEQLCAKEADSDLPERVILIGFDELSPLIKRLQIFLQAHNRLFTLKLPSQGDSAAKRMQFLTSAIEVQEMARWAYQEVSRNKNATVGCILPNLAQRREEVTHIFEDVFYAENEFHHFNAPPYNISASKRLSDFPLIHTALILLSFNKNIIELQDLSALLRTPFIKASGYEFDNRVILDIKLRAIGVKNLKISQLLSEKFFENDCPHFQIALSHFFSLRKQDHACFPISEWAKLFAQQLHEMGWPGERTLTSTEFQLVERFKKCLEEYFSLERFTQPMNFNTAFEKLRNLLNFTLFQPKGQDQPIQILGILEASSIPFDALWIAGLDNETWPPPCSPNPFIPFEIQKQNNMPHATSERELTFSLNITTRLLENAKHIFFTHAQYDGDRALAVSPLITRFPLITMVIKPFESIEKQIYLSQSLESYLDDIGPQIYNTSVRGGSSVLKSQANCPFQAFAKYRLHAHPINEVQIGLAFHERGLLVHEILAKFWQSTKTHEQLMVYSDQQLHGLIDTVIDEVLTRYKCEHPYSSKNQILELERARLKRLIREWIEIEKTRQPFEVTCCEERQSAQIGGLLLDLQIDRMDRLIDGTYLLIDYKTGKPSFLDWFEERPSEPQLPLYSTITSFPLSGVLFGQIRQGDSTFKGLTTYEGIVPGAITFDRLKNEYIDSLQSLILSWRETLTQLAEDFCQGKAQVEPKDVTTCQYCHLQTLCRIQSV